MKTLTNGIPCLPSEGHVMGCVSMHSAVCACSRAEVHISREMLLPSTLYAFGFAEDCAVGTVHLKVVWAPVHSQGNPRHLSLSSLSGLQAALLVILSGVCLKEIR